MSVSIDPDAQKTLHKRANATKKERYRPPWAPGGPDYDPLLPYGPDVYLARKKKPESRWVLVAEVTVIALVICSFVYMYYYIDHLHYNVTKAYAHLGSSDAQHVLAHKYLHGRGVERDEDRAMHWFRQAAEKGHPDASYNIVSAHMQGYNVNLNDREIEKYLKTAHDSGNEEATRALKDMMPHKY